MDVMQLELGSPEPLKRGRDEENIAQIPIEGYPSSEVPPQPPLAPSTTYTIMPQLTPTSSDSVNRDVSPARNSQSFLTDISTSIPITTQNLSHTRFLVSSDIESPPKKRAKLDPRGNEDTRIIENAAQRENTQTGVETGRGEGGEDRFVAENSVGLSRQGADWGSKGLSNETAGAAKRRGKKATEDGDEKLRKEEERLRKEEEKRRKEEEKRRKEELKLRKAEEKDEEKRRKEEEKRLREVEKRRKEEEKRQREAEKRRKDEEKRLRDEEKRRKEEERQRIEEEKKRKEERSQPKLNFFFTPNTSSKIQDSGVSDSASAVRSENRISSLASNSSSKSGNLSDYERRFPPFFIQSSVTIASNRFEKDQSTISNLENALDCYICSGQNLAQQQSLSAATFPKASGPGLKVRGRKCATVRDIMARILGGTCQTIGLATDSQIVQIKMRRDLLKSVPYKILSFTEDVRPPYKGTYTKWPKHGMQKLARNPFRRDLPKVDYDYDSEAEWVADEGEDLESDGGEDEECADDEDDLTEFIDDEDDLTVNARKMIGQDDLDVQCTGLCFEDEDRHNPNQQVSQYRMMIIHESIPDNVPIDPLATHYWAPPTSTNGFLEPRGPLAAVKSTSASVNGPNRTIKMLGPSECSRPLKVTSGPRKLVSTEDMPAFKKAIEGSHLSKIGLIEVLNKQFSRIPKTVLKTTLETVARRVGSKEADKRWTVIEGETTGGT